MRRRTLGSEALTCHMPAPLRMVASSPSAGHQASSGVNVFNITVRGSVP
jgi:hypothetical protein